MKLVAILGLTAGFLLSCDNAPDQEYVGAIECYAAQNAVYEEAKRTGVSMGGQEQSVRAAIAIYRDRARTFARIDGETNDKVEADVKTYLIDFADRYQSSNDKPAMDEAAMNTLRACAETLN